MGIDQATDEQASVLADQDLTTGESIERPVFKKRRGRKRIGGTDVASDDGSGCLPDPDEHNESIKSWSESIRSSTDLTHNPTVTTEINSDDLRKFMTFMIDRAGKTAVSVINTCAMDDSPYWRMLFECGLADAISEEPQMESEFLGRMISKPGLPHAWKLVDYYLTRMPQERKEKLFCEAALRKRDHLSGACFYGASFMNACGAHIMNVLRVMIEHGMPIQPLIERNFSELERATLLGHKPFIAQLAKAGAYFPDDLIRSVYVRAAKCNRDVEIIAMLMTEGQMPLSRFMAPKLITQASKEARAFLDAVALRLERIPESEADPEEEDAAEAV